MVARHERAVTLFLVSLTRLFDLSMILNTTINGIFMMKSFLFWFVFGNLVVATTAVMSQEVANSYGPIKSGERLWNIAEKVRPNRTVSHYQAMLALLKANPHAFAIPCNLNTLEIGHLLHIPSNAKMQALSHTAAVNEFYRQEKEWKASRRHRQPIACPPTHQAVQPEKPINKPATEVAADSPITATTTDSAVPEKIATATDNQTEQLTEPSTWEEFLSWLLETQSQLLIIIGLLVSLVLLLLLFLLRGRRQQRPVANQTVTKKTLMSDDPLEKMPLPDHTSAAVSRQSDHTISANASDAPTDSEPQKNNEMKDKLDHVRAILSEDETQIVQKMLREILQKGSPEQQTEAVQLYEISKKMNTLKPTNKQALAKPPSNTSIQSVWQDIEQKSQHLSERQYLPENTKQVFNLIDKIFELLDYELNAQGKLVEAYMNRSQQDFFSAPNYEIVEKPEKLIVDDEKNNPLGKPRPESQPKRYL